MKSFLAGLWVLVVSLGTTYAVASLGSAPKKAEEAPKSELQVNKARALNVPVIAEGAVKGYVVAQLAYTADAKKTKDLPVSPEIFLLDEAFRDLYTDDSLDFRSLKKYDVNRFVERVKTATNRRLGADIVHDILIQDFVFVPKEGFDQ